MPDRKGQARACKLPLLILIALGILTGGCGPSITPSAFPTPQNITIQVTPTLRPLKPEFSACAMAQKTTALILIESPTSSMGIEMGELAIRWGIDTGTGGFAAVLGYEELVVVVHPQNPLQQISLADLQAVYSGSLINWPEAELAGTIQPWGYPRGEDIQAAFINAVQPGTLPRRNVTSMAPDPQAMLEAVAASPSSIGFVPRRWLTSQVKEINIQGLNQSSLRIPILALTKAEPAGQIKDWLICVQERIGH